MKLFILLITLLLSSITQAEEDNFKYFGNISQSVIYGNNVKVSNSFNNVSFDKREANLFLEYSLPNHQIDIRALIGTTDEYGLDQYRPHVKYALLDKQWGLDTLTSVGLRVGRVPHVLGFYNSTRNAPQSGQFIYLPEGIYREQFKWLAMSGDGIQGYINQALNSDLCYELTGSYTRATLLANREVVAGHFNNPAIGTFSTEDSSVRSIALNVRYTDHLFYYNWINLYFWLTPDYPYSLFIPQGIADTNVHVLGVKKYIKNYEFNIEFLEVTPKGKVWDTIRNDTKYLGKPTGLVLSSTMHYTDKLDLSVYHSQYYTAVGDKQGINQSLATGLPANWFFVRSNSISSKYIIDDKWSLRLQHTIGKGLEPFIRNDFNKTKWSYSVAQLVYRF